MEIIDSNSFDNIINQPELTVVDFSATWCMPCRMMKSVIERVENKLKHIKFYNIDVDDSEDIAKRYRIFSVPTIVCFKGGKKIDSIVGSKTADEIIDFINKCN